MNCPICGGSNYDRDEFGWLHCRERHADYDERLLPGGITVRADHQIMPTGEAWWNVSWHPYLPQVPPESSEEYGCT